MERQTGLGKDTLRVWERRYGFPTPSRDAHGERRYDEAQLQRLRLIKRLLDAGQRPHQVVPLPEAELQTRLQERLQAQGLGLVGLQCAEPLLAQHGLQRRVG